MPFNENKRLDPSQVQDRRGRSTGQTIALGGGGLGIIILLVSMFLGVDLTGLVNTDALAPSTSQEYYEDAGDLTSECMTGADANEDRKSTRLNYSHGKLNRMPFSA